VLGRGAQIYGELCFACHGEDGYGVPRPGDASGAMMAPRLSGSPRVNGHRDYVIKAVLHGMTGPLDGTTYADVMIPNQSNPDDWVAAVSSYVRNNFGNTGGFVTAADVARVRAASSPRRGPWTVTELEASLPKLLISDETWKLSASHNTEAAARALTMTSWTSQTAQVPGMWFQIELPQPAMVTEIQFTSTGGGRGGGGGGGGGQGRGRAAGPPAAPPGPPPTGYPRGYKIETSLNGTTWAVAAQGTGSGPSTTITFRPVRAKFVRMTQTATADEAPPWSIQQMRLFEAPTTPAR
jgi:mono/diheme cytochrome c family protein